MVSGAKDTNTDHGHRAMNPNMTLDGHQVIHFNLLLTAFTSSGLPLSTGHESFCLSPPHQTTHLLTIECPAARCLAVCFLLRVQGGLPQACLWVSLSHSLAHSFKEFSSQMLDLAWAGLNGGG